MSKSKVVYVHQLEVTEETIQKILDVLNEHRYEEEGEPKITLEQVLNKPDLLKYIVDEYVGGMDGDMFEIWNADGWCDINQYL